MVHSDVKAPHGAERCSSRGSAAWCARTRQHSVRGECGKRATRRVCPRRVLLERFMCACVFVCRRRRRRRRRPVCEYSVCVCTWCVCCVSCVCLACVRVARCAYERRAAVCARLYVCAIDWVAWAPPCNPPRKIPHPLNIRPYPPTHKYTILTILIHRTFTLIVYCARYTASSAVAHMPPHRRHSIQRSRRSNTSGYQVFQTTPTSTNTRTEAETARDMRDATSNPKHPTPSPPDKQNVVFCCLLSSASCAPCAPRAPSYRPHGDTDKIIIYMHISVRYARNRTTSVALRAHLVRRMIGSGLLACLILVYASQRGRERDFCFVSSHHPHASCMISRAVPCTRAP